MRGGGRGRRGVRKKKRGGEDGRRKEGGEEGNEGRREKKKDERRVDGEVDFGLVKAGEAYAQPEAAGSVAADQDSWSRFRKHSFL